MIRLAIIGFLYFGLPLAVFIFDAKLGRLGIYAHLCVLCLIPVLFVIALIDVASVLKDGWRRAHFPLVRLSLCLALFLILFLASHLGLTYREYLFRKRLPLYAEVISRAEINVPTNTARWVRLDLPLGQEGIATIVAGRKVNNILMVRFLVSGHFPVRHFGYLYLSEEVSDPVNIGAGRAITKLPLKGWYEFRD